VEADFMNNYFYWGQVDQTNLPDGIGIAYKKGSKCNVMIIEGEFSKGKLGKVYRKIQINTSKKVHNEIFIQLSKDRSYLIKFNSEIKETKCIERGARVT